MRSVPSLLFVLAAAGLPAQAPAPALDYGRDVRPILANACFTCHGPDANKRKAGLRLDVENGDAATKSGQRAIVPTDPEASELLRRVLASGKDKMPPASTGKVLSAEQVDTLRRWIVAGAVRTPHWAFVPPQRPPIAAAATDDPIAHLVGTRLRSEGLSLSPPADKATLLRRVTLDLTGLPPTPEEVAVFLSDARADAYERQIDRLFASPRYAEHMARQWLDAARYGDTHGFHLDNVRTMWPYRDWVVRAFAANMPFDQFTVEQLAGDRLPQPSRDQVIATGFNRCNPTTAEGGLIDAEYLAKYATDRVATTATVWMGLTMQCASCHDHKFDPITQRDFYRMFAFFDSIDENASDGNAAYAPPDVEVPSAEQEARRADLGAQLAAARAALDAPDAELDAAQRAFEASERPRLARMWQPLRALMATSRHGATMLREADGSTVRATGLNPDTDVHEITLRSDLEQIAALRLEALVDPENGKVGRGDNGNFVLSRVEVEAAPLSAPDRARRVELASATADHAQPGFAAAGVLDAADASGWATVDAMTVPHELIVAPQRPFGFAGGTWVRVRLVYASVHQRHALARVRVSASESAALQPATFGVWRATPALSAPPGTAVFAHVFGPEPGASVPAGAADRGTAVPAWSERADLVDGRVHMFADAPDHAATFLRREITCGSERTAVLSFGSDDDLRVWLNGEEVLSREVPRAVAADQDRVRVRLRPGANDLLLEVVNRGGVHGFFFRSVGEELSGMPPAVAQEVLREPASRSASGAAALRSYYRRTFAAGFGALEAKVSGFQGELDRLAAEIPHTMVMREREQRRDTRILERGQYDHPGEHVDPGVPGMFAQLGPMPSRLDLARWLVSGEHPLVARVVVNRLWAQLFGYGIVRTPEDFGYQGEWPTHPRLLDWLACEFVDSGWDVQHVLRTILTSAVYRQASGADAEAWQRDLDNRLLARGPRVRLDAEVIRDSALFASGLLVEQVGGPPVNPYQPAGLWEAVGYVTSNTANFQQDHGAKLYRRSLYTFWKRTSPPASMALFDAPTREACVVRRSRTNTPTQALALLNDTQHVEAARKLAERVLAVPVEAAAATATDASGATADAGGAATVVQAASDRAADACAGEAVVLGRMFRLVLGREPDRGELDILVPLARDMQAHYRADPAAARVLLEVGESPPAAGVEPGLLAAWTMVAQTLLNLDEAVTKR
ncbi:MAG: PSD1 and planctomycete cytochrome C domain-containing protein [Planctomycetota bacterium]